LSTGSRFGDPEKSYPDQIDPSDVALKNCLKSKLHYVITDRKKMIIATKSGSILSGLNLLKNRAQMIEMAQSVELNYSSQ